MQVPLARIIELINNVAQREMAVIKEPRLCVKILSRVWCVGVRGRAVSGAHTAMQPFDLQLEEAKLTLQCALRQIEGYMCRRCRHARMQMKIQADFRWRRDLAKGMLSRTSAQLNSGTRL